MTGDVAVVVVVETVMSTATVLRAETVSVTGDSTSGTRRRGILLTGVGLTDGREGMSGGGPMVRDVTGLLVTYPVVTQ